eukprot:16446435-Heterocapsa_arctica.AAC.1
MYAPRDVAADGVGAGGLAVLRAALESPLPALAPPPAPLPVVANPYQPPGAAYGAPAAVPVAGPAPLNSDARVLIPIRFDAIGNRYREFREAVEMCEQSHFPDFA